MSSIYDISGTYADSFSINGKCTLLQGDKAPENYQGVNGDVYFQTTGSIYAKRDGKWLNLTSNALPDATQANKGKFIISNGSTYGFSDIKIDTTSDNLEAKSFTATSKPSASNSTTSSTVPTIGWVNDPLSSTNVVHRTGDEEIRGTKTFNVNGTQLHIKATNLDSTSIPSAYAETLLNVRDKNNIRIGDFGVGQRDNGAIRTYICASRKIDDVQKYAVIGVYIRPDGTMYTECPTPAINSNTNEIVTTNWVNNKIKVVSTLPANPDSNVFYFVTA